MQPINRQSEQPQFRDLSAPHEEASFEDRSRVRAAMERFDWLHDGLRDQVHAADAAALGEVLKDENARTSSQERALTLLALLGSARAEALLEWFDPGCAHWRVRLLHRIARRECARRRARRSRGCAQYSTGDPSAQVAYGVSNRASTASGGRPRAAFLPAMTTGRSMSDGCSHIASMRSSRLSVSSSRLSNV